MIRTTPYLSEKVLSSSLRELYASYGYRHYRMSRFEEYDLYVENKAFLRSDSIITFNDLDGRLMALKPDVTLSIARKAAPEKGCTEKVFYSENVFRADNNSHSYKEIRQIGLEAIGCVDEYATGEAVLLALKSLALISPDYLLDVSHLGFLMALLSAADPDSAHTADLILCIRQKNLHDLRKQCQTFGISELLTDRLCKLAGLYGSAKDVLPTLRELSINAASEAALKELTALCDLLDTCGLGNRVNLDFSLVNDLDYYKGIIFQGYIASLPDMVLSGGRYDNLMRKWGRKDRAIGFAIYLPALEQLMLGRPEYDVDVLVTYTDDISPVLLAERVEALRNEGIQLQVQREVPSGLRYRKHIVITGEGEQNNE